MAPKWKPHPLEPYPLPRELVRDLLGITRALYRATKAEDPNNAELLLEFERIGKMYRRSLQTCLRHGPETIAHMDGVREAERATKALGKVVNHTMSVPALVRATARRAVRALWRED
jgi:hypothetical protein